MSSILLILRINNDQTISTLSELPLVTINFLAKLSLCRHPLTWALPIKFPTISGAISRFFSSQGHLKIIYSLILLSLAELLKPYSSHCCFWFDPTHMGTIFHMTLLEILSVIYFQYAVLMVVSILEKGFWAIQKHTISCYANKIFIFVNYYT